MVTTTQSTANEGFNNHIAFNSMREQLERQYPHQWVIIHDQTFMGNYETYDSAREGARNRGMDLAHCLFQKLNPNPPIILSYGE